MFKNGANQDKDMLLQEILEKSDTIEAIDLYAANKSSFTNPIKAKSIEEALFVKLMYKDPLKLTKMFYTLHKKKSLPRAEVSKILDRQKGGYYTEMISWLEGFEKLGYLTTQRIESSQVKPKYIYILNKNYAELVKILPSVYWFLAEEKSLDDSNIFIEHQNQISLDVVCEYIDDINEKLSYIRVDKEKEEPFKATVIIHSLLDNGATIHEAFFVLDGISEKLAKVIPAIATLEHTRIEKRDISSKISEVLKDKKIYHLYYWYRAEEILNKFNIKHTKEAAELIKKQILKNPWDKESTDEEIYSEVFKQIYGSNIDDFQNKEFLLSELKKFFKTISNEKDEKLNYKFLREYSELMKKLALSILIKTGYLSSNTNPVRSLKKIITSSPILNIGDFKNPINLIIKLRDSQDPVSQYIRKQFSNDMVKLLDEYEFEGSIYLSKAVQNALVGELNQIIKGNSLYDVQCFKQIRTLVDQNQHFYETMHFNRLLLEKAYPDEIMKSTQINESIKKIRSQKSFNEFSESIKFNSRLIEKIDNNLNAEIKISDIEPDFHKIISFYEKFI